MQEILQYAIDFGWVQWLAVLFNILYVIYAARQNIWCWPFGLIGVSLLLSIYINVQLYSDALLQIFYMGMSIYGWISWRHSQDATSPSIHQVAPLRHLLFLAIGSAGAIILGFFWQKFGAALPFIDAFTTSFSIIATFLVARKVLENWIYWIVIDLVCVYVYWLREIYLVSMLFLLYTVLAIFGWISWRRSYQEISQASLI